MAKRFKRVAAFMAIVLTAPLAGGCVVVPQAGRRYLADPTMKTVDDALEQRGRDKLHNSREAAAGGNGQPAGGGCACGN
ncbi:MAG: DUF4266 domain-containing protein [Polyangiaceae bacterium]